MVAVGSAAICRALREPRDEENWIPRSSMSLMISVRLAGEPSSAMVDRVTAVGCRSPVATASSSQVSRNSTGSAGTASGSRIGSSSGNVGRARSRARRSLIGQPSLNNSAAIFSIRTLSARWGRTITQKSVIRPVSSQAIMSTPCTSVSWSFVVNSSTAESSAYHSR